MSQYQKQRHAAAMLVHQIGSGIEALEEVPRNIALENLEDLQEQFLKFGKIIVRLCDIQIASNNFHSTHN